MADWVSALCEREDLEEAKRRHIAGSFNSLADSLKRELENCISAYNQRHPQDLPGARAATVNVTGQTTDVLFSVRKGTGHLEIVFHINEAKLTAKGTGLPKGTTYTIDPEVRNQAFVTTGVLAEAVYFVRGERKHRVPELVSELLSPLLFPQFCTFPE
jgi:hypothetical protein